MTTLGLFELLCSSIFFGVTVLVAAYASPKSTHRSSTAPRPRVVAIGCTSYRQSTNGFPHPQAGPVQYGPALVWPPPVHPVTTSAVPAPAIPRATQRRGPSVWAQRTVCPGARR